MVEPGRIQKLDETVVNRIAAGEVVQRPSAAIKEMLENCLDAGATSITVTVKGGGMQLLLIQDNGSGIKKEDLGIVCERFTTSKLTTFEDLRTISTFGFRGEALASITHVAHVTITTRTADAQCAYKAKYSDGKLVPVKPGGKAEPSPCAGTVGTTIAVEDLFYNMHTRKSAFKNLNEQYQRVLDVVTKYAVHYSASATSSGSGSTSGGVNLHTQGTSVTDTIRLAYGAAVARELLDVEFSTASDFAVSGKLSNANYSSKRGMFILFINHRLVESASIKRVVEGLYAELLPKHSHPFAYLAITMPAHHVDVNVHPTKKEVHFLHEAELLEMLHKQVTILLQGANSSRTFYAQSQSLLPFDGGGSGGPVNVSVDDMLPTEEKSSSSSSNDGTHASNAINTGTSATKRPPIDAKRFVRVDPSVVKIDQVFGAVSQTVAGSSSSSSSSAGRKLNNNDFNAAATGPPGATAGEPSSAFVASCLCCGTQGSLVGTRGDRDPRRDKVLKKRALALAASNSGSGSGSGIGSGSGSNNLHYGQDESNVPVSLTFSFQETPVNYDSLRTLLAAVRNSKNSGLQKAISHHVVVGIVDTQWSAVQCGTRLLLLDHTRLCEHLFYQLALRRFAVMPIVPLAQPVPIRSYILAALQSPEAQWSPEDGSQESIATKATTVLLNHAAMLKEYFSINIEPASADADADADSGTGINEVAVKDEIALLSSIPELVPTYRPCAEHLPMFLLRLATDTNWEAEKECFQTIALNLGSFYSKLPTEIESHSSDEHKQSDHDGKLKQREQRLFQSISFTLTNVLLPAVRAQLLLPAACATDGTVVQVAALEQLYKVFERC
eukprot:GSChrysophyteH2.ASY1.ANO1.400.1 assembled CDS